MILRHLHNPAIRITLPLGGALQFENYLCTVHSDVVALNGQGFFDTLVLDGKVEVIDKKKKEVEEENTITPEQDKTEEVSTKEEENKVEEPVKSIPVKQTKTKK